MRQKLLLSFILISFKLMGQNWSGATPGNIYYNSGNIGINNSSPDALLDIRTGSSTQLYLSTSRTFSTSRNWGIGTNWNSEGDYVILESSAYNTVPTLTRFKIDLNGNVGIGTTAPQAPLDVTGGSVWNGTVRANGSSYSSFGLYQNNILRWALYHHPGINNTLLFANSAGQDKIAFTQEGNVGIGTIFPDYKLTVNGKIKAEEIQVVVDVPADYVFEKNYQLRSLEEVENFIETNGHLPGVPGAEQLKSDGWQVGEMNNKLLEKIEEITLYLIDLKKQNDAVKIENIKLKNRLELLEKRIE